MSASKKQKEALKRYVKKHDRLEVLLPLGAKQILKEHVNMLGVSMTKYADRALKMAIAHDRAIMAEQAETKSIRAMRKPTKKNTQHF